jgi:hypothetical protein
MQATQRGGLTGKARSNRLRNRVQRMQAQQMLDEYFEIEDHEISPRPVPLRGRAEFLPTVDSWTQEDASFETGDQLEFTVQATEGSKNTQSNNDLDSQFDAALDTPDHVENPATDKVAPTVTVIPAPYWLRPRATFQPQGGRLVECNFDLRRFVYGCALGTAAAAAILLAVSTVVH